MVGKRDYPINIELAHWEKQKSYWSNLETEKKAEQMSNTKSKVMNMGNVGRLSKIGKDAKLIFVNQPYFSLKLNYYSHFFLLLVL